MIFFLLYFLVRFTTNEEKEKQHRGRGEGNVSRLVGGRQNQSLRKHSRLVQGGKYQIPGLCRLRERSSWVPRFNKWQILYRAWSCFA